MLMFMQKASLQSAERLFPQTHWRKQDQHLLFLRQLFAYRYAEALVTGKKVLDLGCGAGYGITMLAKQAYRAVGMDRDREGLSFAHTHSHQEETPPFFVMADAHHLPFLAQTFDVVLSFQVIEHVRQPVQYLQAIKRILVPDGLAIFTTPNRRLRLLPWQRPWNQYHLQEYDWRQFRRLLQVVFSRVSLLGITAIEEIVTLEKCRVKQDPWLVYGELFYQYARNLAPAFVMHSLAKSLQGRRERKAKRLVQIQYPGETSRQYTVNDYRVVEEHLADCLDLLACCWI
jgi:ubiquinone/menaquinone biosynthesis C-methylase UbiE